MEVDDPHLELGSTAGVADFVVRVDREGDRRGAGGKASAGLRRHPVAATESMNRRISARSASVFPT